MAHLQGIQCHGEVVRELLVGCQVAKPMNAAAPGMLQAGGGCDLFRRQLQELPGELHAAALQEGVLRRMALREPVDGGEQ
eukprot:2854345-Pyramimonas_sp.AAC.1